jgi:branched-chain amino acid transport system ATP-binding protein
MATNALEIEDLVVTYGGAITGVSGVSLAVPEGGLVALLGANGAGKTTVLKAASGLLPFEKGRVARGSIRVFGEPVGNTPAHRLARKGMMHVREGRRIFGGLTVEENLRAAGFALDARSKLESQIAAVYEFFPILGERRNGQAGYLSGGEQQMLAIGRALIAQPKLILVDEASLGLSPMMAKEIFAALSRINAERRISVLIVEQNARLALNHANYAYVLEVGKLVMEGPAKELAANDAVAARYLGGH